MAFIHGPSLPTGSTIRRSNFRRKAVCSQYLPWEALNVRFDAPSKSGNFGMVFFGEYSDPAAPSSPAEQIVVKCPVESSLGRQLYAMEKYTNKKLRQKQSENKRFPPFLGEVVISADSSVIAGLVRLGLVWKRVGDGETLEDFLVSSRLGQLGSLLGAPSVAAPLRRELSAKVLAELALVLQDLQETGIVHRDVKPENLLVVPEDADAPFKAIDFGSSCDWSSPFKKGLGVATCDPIYTAPEKRLDIFKPAYRFDVYSIGLIALRCALPSLTEKRAMNAFVENILKACDFSFQRTCNNILAGSVSASPSLKNDVSALSGPEYEDMYALFATILDPDPNTRADVADCLRSRFVRRSAPSLVV
eukprot:GFKZ01003196.1.p1 GENE.GFKZ01003196.1~~GFKZ01003196.1.p1  ORF type:complete len:361 (+),score=48.99 GFKZ01003196.1:661-1743(+)